MTIDENLNKIKSSLIVDQATLARWKREAKEWAQRVKKKYSKEYLEKDRPPGWFLLEDDPEYKQTFKIPSPPRLEDILNRLPRVKALGLNGFYKAVERAKINYDGSIYLLYVAGIREDINALVVSSSMSKEGKDFSGRVCSNLRINKIKGYSRCRREH